MLLWMKPLGPLQAAERVSSSDSDHYAQMDPAVGSDYASCVVLINASRQPGISHTGWRR